MTVYSKVDLSSPQTDLQVEKRSRTSRAGQCPRNARTRF
jgi:hypothetical protein